MESPGTGAGGAGGQVRCGQEVKHVSSNVDQLGNQSESVRCKL